MMSSADAAVADIATVRDVVGPTAIASRRNAARILSTLKFAPGPSPRSLSKAARSVRSVRTMDSPESLVDPGMEISSPYLLRCTTLLIGSTDCSRTDGRPRDEADVPDLGAARQNTKYRCCAKICLRFRPCKSAFASRARSNFRVDSSVRQGPLRR